MNRHIIDKEITSYIHQTLTDAQRESMNRHLDKCPQCRERISQEKQWQRRIQYQLSSDLRQVTPSTKMQFRTIAPNLNRSRRRAFFQFHTMRLMTGFASVTAVLLIFMFVSSAWRAVTLTSPDTAYTAGLFDTAWEFPEPYQHNLIGSEQDALALLKVAPIYHIELSISPTLTHIEGQQQLRYINKTNHTLDSLYFRLLPNLGDSILTVTETRVNGRLAATTHTDPATLELTLPQPLPPDKTAVIHMNFNLQVGQERDPFEGSVGLSNRNLSLAHFHPTLAARHNDDWYLQNPIYGEGSFADTSFYQVQITAPAEMTLITSGIEIRHRIEGQKQTTTYAAGPIDQFFLAASDQYTVISQTVGQTRINSYVPSQQLYDQAEEVLHYASLALESYNQRFGAYPFTELDIISTSNFPKIHDGLSFPWYRPLVL